MIDIVAFADIHIHNLSINIFKLFNFRSFDDAGRLHWKMIFYVFNILIFHSYYPEKLLIWHLKFDQNFKVLLNIG